MAGFEANLYLVLVLYHSINHQYIENSESAAVGSHGISELSKQKLSIIDCKSEDIIRLLFQSRKNVLVVWTFRFHAIGVWTPKTIGRASRAFRNINVHIYFSLQKRDSLEELIASSLRVGLIMV